MDKLFDSGQTILISGGAGFLGSHLAGRLVERGNHVYCLDNLHTGRRENLAPYMQTGRLTFIEHDMTQPLPRHLPRFDQIYNLACPASPVHYQEDPVATLRVCSQGALHVLDRAARDGAAIFHTSTSEIYGDPEITRSAKAITATSIRWGRAPAMTRASASPKR